MVKKMQRGPDPKFPYLGEFDRFRFPDPLSVSGNIIAMGGNLSPGMLLSAYEQGIFPWYNPEDPILWQSPDPRCLIFSNTLHVSNSMEKILKTNIFKIYFDRSFPAVIKACSEIKRRGQPGTWITDDIINAYNELHRLGYAHCMEAWQDGVLEGGCYGVLLGRAFFGESMFSVKANASKAAFISLARQLISDGVRFIDCQQPTRHMGSLGGEEISRKDFINMLLQKSYPQR